MSTDPNPPRRAAAASPDAVPPDEGAEVAQPTVAVPAMTPPPPPPGGKPPVPANKPPAVPTPARPAAQEETQLAQAQPEPEPQHAPPTTRMPVPAVPPAEERPTRWERPQQPTQLEQPQPQWHPAPQPQPQQPRQPQPQQPGQSERWSAQPQRPEQPQRSEQASPWTEAQPWVEPTGQQARPKPDGSWAQPPGQGQRGNQGQPGYQPPNQQGRKRRKHPVRRWVMAVGSLVVLLVVLVVADRVALAVTENDMASQFQQQGFPTKPNVTIEGFPFLTQLLSKDFNKVDVSATNVPVPLPSGGTLTISSVKATVNGLHLSSLSTSATARVDKLNASAFISYSALTAAGGIAGVGGVQVSRVNNDTAKITASLAGVVSDSEDVQFTVTGPQTISVKAIPTSGNDVLGSVLSQFGSFSFNLPKGTPPSLKITNLSLNSQGLTASATATNATLSGS